MLSLIFQQLIDTISHHILMCVQHYIPVTHELQYICYNSLTISYTFLKISI